MTNLRLTYRTCLLLAAASIVACENDDTVEPPPEPAVTASRDTVRLAPGTQSVVVISGGRAPFSITEKPNTLVATASLDDSTKTPLNLTITALVSALNGSTTLVSVGDADEISEGGSSIERAAHGENEVTIQIIIDTSATLSFSSDVQPVFTTRCAISGCHAGTMPQNDLSLESGQSYAEIVDVPAIGPECAGEPRVDPGLSAGSVLYKRIIGSSCGPRMPFTIGHLLDTLSIE